MRMNGAAVGAAILLLVSTAALQAQAARPPLRFGFQVDYSEKHSLGVGGRMQYGLQGIFPDLPLRSIVSVDAYPNGDAHFDFNYHVVYDFTVANAPKAGLYAGAGLSFGYTDLAGGSSRSDLGLSLLGGIAFRSSRRLTPLFEVRGVLAGNSQLVVTGGVLF